MRLLLVPALLVATMAGCMDEGTHDIGPTGQIDGAALNHLLVPYADTTVQLIELELEAQTTELGGFSFYDVPVGFYTLELNVPGAGLDREVVAVAEDEISRVILQVFPDEIDEPRVALRSDVEIVQVAMPGESCEECSWRTNVDGLPAAVELLVEWDARHPAFAQWHTDLEVELQDAQGDRLAGPLTGDEYEDGRYVIHALLHAEDLPDDLTSVKVQFGFPDDNPAPHPDFQVDSRVCLHYVEEEERTACSL